MVQRLRGPGDLAFACFPLRLDVLDRAQTPRLHAGRMVQRVRDSA